VHTIIQISKACIYETRGSLSRVVLALVTRVNIVVMPNVTLAGAAGISIQNDVHEDMTKKIDGM
jgi:hypothetical protein